MSGLLCILYSTYQGQSWLLGGFVNEGGALLADPHVRLLSRMKIQGLKWEKEQMNGPSPKPQLDPLTSWS